MLRRARNVVRHCLRAVLKVILNRYIMREIASIYHNYVLDQERRLRSSLQSCGYGVRINGQTRIQCPRALVLGNCICIENGCFFASEGGLTIGDNTHISRNVTIYTTSNNHTGKGLPDYGTIIHKPVSIGKNVWIGSNVCITPGVRIEDEAIIGSGALVSENVAPRTIVGSAPERALKRPPCGRYEELDRVQEYDDVNMEALGEPDLASFGRHPCSNDVDLFFVLSTGRSGTMTIAKTLSQHSEVECIHEGRPQLIRLSTELAHNIKTVDEVTQELRDIYEASVIPPTTYGESDQKFWNLVPLLDSLFPKCKFIWLVRNARKVVASTYGREWYNSEDIVRRDPTGPRIKHWRFYRINGARCGCCSEQTWESMSSFEKNCWYWSYINRTIKNSLLRIEPTRWLKVRLEDLEEHMPELLDFLKVKPLPPAVLRKNRARYKISGYEEWSDAQKQQFEHWCGEQMQEHYPDWKRGDL